MIGADGHHCSSSVSVMNTSGFFPRLGTASVFDDFAHCRRVSLCVCVGVGCVHLSYAEAGCVLIVFVST